MTLPEDLVADLIRALPLADLIEIVDVGASALATSGKPPYEPLLTLGLARLTAFEPNPDEFAKLQSTATRRYLPDAIGDGGPATLHLTRHAGFASTLVPDPRVTAHIHSFTALTEVMSRETLPTTRIDDLAEIARIDWLKIDIQGGELAAFASGRTKLSRALCIQTEVAFVPFYRDQPSFADQDAALRDLGLRFFGFASANRFPYAGTPNALYFVAKRQDIGQWIDADAVYLRDFTHWDTLPPDDMKRLFLIVTFCYPALSATLRLAGMMVRNGILPEHLFDRLKTAASPQP